MKIYLPSPVGKLYRSVPLCRPSRKKPPPEKGCDPAKQRQSKKHPNRDSVSLGKADSLEKGHMIEQIKQRGHHPTQRHGDRNEHQYVKGEGSSPPSLSKGKKAYQNTHEGNEQTTVLNLEVVSVDSSKNAILVKGCIPGPNKGLVTIRSAVKAQKGNAKAKTLVDYSSSAETVTE